MPAAEPSATLSPVLSLNSGNLAASFVPRHGMLGASLTFRGVEMLRRIENLPDAAAKGSTAGIPILYPWANRLAGFRYHAAGREVTLSRASPLLHLDGNGLPIHGVPWSMLPWTVHDSRADRLHAALDWSDGPLLTIFPFPHRVEMTAALTPDALTIRTAVIANRESHVPVSFGFHPYFGLPEPARSRWRFRTPAMQRLELDDRLIPTGRALPFPAADGELADRTFDDGFAALDNGAVFAISGGGVRLSVEFLHGYPFAQVYAPPGKDFIAIEPMTAPANALATGRSLPIVPPGGRFDAAFSIRMEDLH